MFTHSLSIRPYLSKLYDKLEFLFQLNQWQYILSNDNEMTALGTGSSKFNFKR